MSSPSSKGLTVAFSEPVSKEETDAIIAAIKQIRHVADVTTIESRVSDDWLAERRVSFAWGKELLGLYERLVRGDYARSAS